MAPRKRLCTRSAFVSRAAGSGSVEKTGGVTETSSTPTFRSLYGPKYNLFVAEEAAAPEYFSGEPLKIGSVEKVRVGTWKIPIESALAGAK